MPRAALGARMAQAVTIPPMRPSCWMAAMPGLPARMPVITLPDWSTAQAPPSTMSSWAIRLSTAVPTPSPAKNTRSLLMTRGMMMR